MKIRKTINFFVVGLLLLSSCVYAIDPPNLLSPENGHEHIKLEGQAFDWSDVNGATSYRIVVADNASFLGFNDTGDSNASCNQRCKTERTTLSEFSGFSGLKENVRYYWKVRSNASGWSNVYSFTPKYGAVRVVIYPTELHDRAKFQVVTDFGGIGWESSGKIVSKLNYESVQIEFSPVEGWKKPQNQTAKVVKGRIENVYGTYEKSAAVIPDLIIDTINLTKSTVTENETFDIAANVKNIGSGVSAASTLRLYRSNDAVINSSDTELNSRVVNSLSENGNQSLSYSGYISVAGTYYIGACVDAVVGESSTTNNCSEGKEIVVTKKDQQVNGACGSANNHQFSYSESAYGTYKQCSSGNSNNTKFPEEGKSITWSCVGGNGGTSADCSASRSTNPNNQSQPPVLKNTKNLDSCLTDKSKKCVKINQSVSLKFDITDINNNISKLQVDWNGDGNPEYSESFSGGQVSAEAPYKFSSTDIQDCPNNTIFRNDGVCWKQNVTLTATAYDESGNASKVFSQGFILYDETGYQKATADLKAAEEEKKRLAEQIKAEQLSQQQTTSNETTLQAQCSAKLNIDGWKADSLLRPNDPFSSSNDAIGVQRKSQQYVIKCPDGDPLCKNGYSYKIVVTYNHQYFSPTGSINFPAKIESFVTDLFKQVHFETDYVNNLSQKDAYIKSLVYRLKNEISARSGSNNLTCNRDDFREWSVERWKSKVMASPQFSDAVNSYASNAGISKEEASKAVAEGAAKALKEIASSYTDLLGSVDETIDSSLVVVRAIFNSNPQATIQNIKEQAAIIGDIAKQIGEEIVEILPSIRQSLSHLEAKEQIFFASYIGVHIAHEAAPTSKLKLLKLGSLKRMPWLTDSLLYVRVNGLGFRLSKASLDSLDNDSRNIFVDALHLKGDPISENHIEIAQELDVSKKTNKQFLENIIRGRKFNRERWDPKKSNELYLCKPPANEKDVDGCKKRPPQYVILDAYDARSMPNEIISRKHTQLAEVKFETAKGYIDELSKKYKPESIVATVESTVNGTDKNKTNIGMAGKYIEGIQVLEVPKQNKRTAEEMQRFEAILKYATDKKIKIREVY